MKRIILLSFIALALTLSNAAKADLASGGDCTTTPGTTYCSEAGTACGEKSEGTCKSTGEGRIACVDSAGKTLDKPPVRTCDDDSGCSTSGPTRAVGPWIMALGVPFAVFLFGRRRRRPTPSSSRVE